MKFPSRTTTSFFSNTFAAAAAAAAAAACRRHARQCWLNYESGGMCGRAAQLPPAAPEMEAAAGTAQGLGIVECDINIIHLNQ